MATKETIREPDEIARTMTILLPGEEQIESAHDPRDNDGRTIVPSVFYRDEDPPDPPGDDPHWREFPLYNMKGTHLLIAVIVIGVTFASFVHIAIIYFM